MRIWDKYFPFFYHNSFICEYPCLNVILLELALVLYRLLVIFSYTRGTCLVLWAFSSHPYYYDYPLLTPLSLHAQFSLLFWWRTMSQVLNPLYYICLISLELDRVICTWYWFETKFGVAVGTSNILSLGCCTSRTLVKKYKKKKVKENW